MDKILEVKRLKVAFRTTNGTLKAVRDISFDLERGKTLAIVGESGSGKSVTSKAIIGILAGNAIVEGGEILYDGKDLLRVPEDVMHKLRGDKISMIFQDPLSSLNPIVKIGKQITEAMLLKNKSNRREARKDFNDMLRLLKTHMLAASDAKDAARINEMCATFDKFSIQATKLEQAYNAAHSEATELISNLEDLLFKASKKQNIDYKARLNELAQKLPRIENPSCSPRALICFPPPKRMAKPAPPQPSRPWRSCAPCCSRSWRKTARISSALASTCIRTRTPI